MRAPTVIVAVLALVGGSLLAATPAFAVITTAGPSITVGSSPVGVAFNPAGTTGYVANSGSNTLSVIDRATGTLQTPIAVCNGPMGVGIVSATEAYVPCYTDREVAVVNLTTGLIEKLIPVGIAPFFIAMSPDGSKAYVPNSGSASVSVIDTSTDTVTATIPVGLAPVAVAFTPDGSRAYVANGTASAGGNSVSVIQVSSSTVVTTIPLTGVPYGVAISPDGTSAYVSRVNGGKISIIDTATNTVGTTFTLAAGTKPEGVTFSPDGTRVYVPTLANGVAVIDATTQTLLAPLASGSGSRILAFTPDGTTAYVTNNLAGTVSVFSFDNALPTITGNPDPGAPGAQYSFTPTVTGTGTTVGVSSGPLPPGLALVDGSVTGIPTTAGSYPVTLRATNDNGSADLVVTFDIAVPPPPTITGGASASAPVGAAFSWTPTIDALDGYVVTSTVLPLGLTLDPATGVISGTPAGPPGATSVTLTVSDDNGSGTFDLTITVAAAVTPLTANSGPSGALAFTGGTVGFGLVPLGLAAVAGGVGLLVVGARRRRGRGGAGRA